MKRILTILAGLAVSVSLMAQAQIITKKEKLSDFTLKTLKVALPGNEILDAALRDAVKISWQITPYEFCTLEEFEKLKKSKDYYFMVPVKSVYKKTKLPGIMMLTVVKGATGEKLDDMLEVATIPVCPAENPTGREAAFLPALVDILQNSVSKSLDGKSPGVSARGSIPAESRVIFCSDDLSAQIGEKESHSFFSSNSLVVDADTADEAFTNGIPGTLVSYTIAPAQPEKGALCFKMLIDARTHELYYYKKHKISKSAGAGFLKSDVRHICRR